MKGSSRARRVNVVHESETLHNARVFSRIAHPVRSTLAGRSPVPLRCFPPRLQERVPHRVQRSFSPGGPWAGSLVSRRSMSLCQVRGLYLPHGHHERPTFGSGACRSQVEEPGEFLRDCVPLKRRHWSAGRAALRMGSAITPPAPEMGCPPASTLARNSRPPLLLEATSRSLWVPCLRVAG